MDGQAEFYMPAHAGGGKRRADGAWMTNAKYLAIPAAIRMTKALHFVVPDFIIENKSYGLGFNNTLVFQKLKMNNWILAGVRLVFSSCAELRRHYLYCVAPAAGAVPLVDGAQQVILGVFRLRVDWPAQAGPPPDFGDRQSTLLGWD